MTSEAKTFDVEEQIKSFSPDLTCDQEITQQDEDGSRKIFIFLIFLVEAVWLSCPFLFSIGRNVLEVVSMDFITELNNNNNSTMQQSHYVPLASMRWDLSIQVPTKLIGDSICLQGDLQASFLYKNVTLVTSSSQSYNKLEPRTQLLNVSAVATGEDLNGTIWEEIIEAIKEGNEVPFGSRFHFTDCRKETKTLTMTFECDAAMLRFKLESDQIKATLIGNHITCINTN